MGRKTLLTMTGAVYIVAAITAIAVYYARAGDDGSG